jgi:hypothetical protein
VAGTGISVSGATGAVTITNSGVTSITGTASQITASASTGGITLSLPNPINVNTSGSSASCTGNAATATTATTATTANALNSANNYSVTKLTATPNTSGVSTGITVVNGDLTAYRSGGTTGVVYLSSSGSIYLYWDGTNYNMPTGNLIVGANITAYSDETLKKDWKPIQDGFVNKLSKIKSGTYTRIDNNVRQAGASAQNFRELLPETVIEDENGVLSLAYGNAALVAAIELAKEVVELRKEIELLKAK